MHQIRAEKRLGVKTNVKIIYFTQLLGLALGLSPRKVGLDENVSDALVLPEGEAAGMRSLAEIGAFLDQGGGDAAPGDRARDFLAAGEEVLEHWLIAHDKAPTARQSEGFRLLALHRQAAKGDPSFNACRETCRELVYHYNVIVGRAGRRMKPPRAPR